VPQACDLGALEAEAEGLKVQGQSGLHSKTLFQENKNITKQKNSNISHCNSV
jgi:hypothetical protein